MLVDSEKDYLVSAKLVREKLARLCEERADDDGDNNCPEDYEAMTCAASIRAADLSDCAVYTVPVLAMEAEYKRQIESLSARVAELKKDAERYRWLREENSKDDREAKAVVLFKKWHEDMELDLEIDAAKEGE